MATFTLVSEYTASNPHGGLISIGYYKQDSNNLFEKPHKAVFFNRHAPMVINADVVEVKLDGLYAYPNGARTRAIRQLAIKNKQGEYLQGFSPDEIIAHAKHVLRKVEV